MKQFYTFLFVPLTFSPAAAQLVYKDVAGIFYNRCTKCHHVGGGAPFSMMNYSETAPWALLIQNALQTGKMPPWPPDTTYTRFLHERIITASEKNAIFQWINDGTLAGDTTLAPAPPVYPKYKLYGTPDLILKVPNFPSNAGSNDAYNCFSLPTGLTQDRILRAFEIVPGNAALIHHVVVKVDTVGNTSSNTTGSCYNQPGHFSMGGYAPGAPPSVYPSGAQLKMGMRIKAGSKINMQMHYPAGSAGQIDSTQIRLYFYPVGASGIRQIYSNTFLQNWNMIIPPNTVQTFTAQYPSGSGTLPSDISIYSSFPHAHQVNKSMLIYAYRSNPPDTIPLIHIPNWDFDWQGSYIHRNMVKIPAGYKLFSRHVYDNTTNNPNNPNNPPQLVTAGTDTKDEMLFDSFEWAYYQPGDELIDIGSLLANDSLLTPMPMQEIESPQIATYVYPNPACESATIVIMSENIADCELKLFDIFGKEVQAEIKRSDVFTVGQGMLPAGLYFYRVKAGKNTGAGKLFFITE